MKLLLDIGNSVVKWALQEQAQLTGFAREIHRNNLQPAVFKNFPSAELVLDSIDIASVASPQTQTFFADYLMQHYGLTPVFAKSDAEFHGVINAYSHPEQLGVDRWLAIIAAYQQVEGAVLVVGCGTAITVDAVSSSGKHLGGLILPGFYTMWQGLHANTGITSKMEFNELVAANLLADNTELAVASGPVLAISALVEKILNKLRTNEQHVSCILTGGDAGKLHTLISEKTILSPYLVLEGLSLRTENSPRVRR